MRTNIQDSVRSETEDFREHVLSGLGLESKRIASRYFYDAEGDRIFQRIMASPEYYLTRAEDEILRERTDELIEALVNGYERFTIVEMGAGDGTKTKHLLRRAIQQGRDPLYVPIDISRHVLRELEMSLQAELPQLRTKGEQGDYFEAIQGSFADDSEPKVILFLGSNIGNLDRERAIALLKGVAEHMGTRDRFLVGFDRKKDPAIILNAYNDAEGHTRDFNLNLLHRINRELGADFRVDRFIHAPVYCPSTGRALSYLVSSCDQTVHIPGAKEIIRFREWEAIHTETSQKYDDRMINDLARNAGLVVAEIFTDSQGLFLDVIFQLDQRSA